MGVRLAFGNVLLSYGNGRVRFHPSMFCSSNYRSSDRWMQFFGSKSFCARNDIDEGVKVYETLFKTTSEIHNFLAR